MKKLIVMFLSLMFLASLSLSINTFGQASVDPENGCLIFMFNPIEDEPEACAGSGSGCHKILRFYFTRF